MCTTPIERAPCGRQCLPALPPSLPTTPPRPPSPAGLHGASVVITGRRKDVLDGAVASLRAEGVTAAGLQGDVRSAPACAEWVATTLKMFGGLDILVNCAAGNFLANAAELSQGGFKSGRCFWRAWVVYASCGGLGLVRHPPSQSVPQRPASPLLARNAPPNHPTTQPPNTSHGD